MFATSPLYLLANFRWHFVWLATLHAVWRVQEMLSCEQLLQLTVGLSSSLCHWLIPPVPALRPVVDGVIDNFPELCPGLLLLAPWSSWCCVFSKNLRVLPGAGFWHFKCIHVNMHVDFWWQQFAAELLLGVNVYAVTTFTFQMVHVWCRSVFTLGTSLLDVVH